MSTGSISPLSVCMNLSGMNIATGTWNCPNRLCKRAAADEQNATRYTLLHVLECSLRTLHPFMPFITEEIWQRLKAPLKIEGESIMLQAFPQAGDID